ncbi:NERD domain-containing protein [Nocardioides ginsengisoli]|uniref:NERD domain-containing protein n=1 Tax=Nocardioides ginsengisoli TaxID=363868 RepID=A0ABW3W502_9ACTN
MDVPSGGVPTWVVKRWRRHGQDRLYVELADGTKVGYGDLEAGTAHPSAPPYEPLLLCAIADWKGRHPPAPITSVLTRVLGAQADDGRWRVLHAIPPGPRAGAINQLVIGPGGVFTITTTRRPGAGVRVLRSARHQAERAGRRLGAAYGHPVAVEGLVVPADSDEVGVTSRSSGVAVVPQRLLADWLLRHGDTLAPAAVESLYDVARRPSTWH